jgi:hypothetical protein
MSRYDSIGRNRRTESFPLYIARGMVPGHDIVTVSGSVITTTSMSTVWNNGGLYTYPASATQMTVSSTNAADTAAGAGARVVFVNGLDADYNPSSEYISMNGQTAVTTTKSYLRINGLNVVNGAPNVGDIHIGVGTVTAGVPATTYGEILAGNANSLQAIYTVPANYDAYFHAGYISTGTTSSNKYIKGKLMVRPFGGVLGVTLETTLNNGINSFQFEYPITFFSKSDIEARAISSSGGDDVAVIFQLVLVHRPD